ncbi:MAG TPA: SDR family NAD(P)-dependent oxidoreductase, partial [Acidobacteriota bacterium]|nr:SDR family NAD(P)-dependent oxidoreductase [Acidobacteriota bacterium]
MGETVRTALVTGGNRGIGLAVAEALARRGVEVLLGARDPRLGEEAAGALRERLLTVRAVELDVADPESIRRCVEDLAAAR